MRSAAVGLRWLFEHRLILLLILFLAGINLVASAYEAALPAMVLSKPMGGETVLGMINTCVGIATLCGSLLATLLPAPKNRVRVICLTLFFSMSTENFMLAFGRNPLTWCIAAVLGWILIPVMNVNMDVIFRSTIPPELQGRVYSCRNTMQFFTIPLGYLLGGVLIDEVCEPFMSAVLADHPLTRLFGTGKGAGAALMFFLLGIAGIVVCLAFTIPLKKFDWRDPD